MRRLSFFVLLFALFCSPKVFAETPQDLTSPPSSLPVQVETSFYLWDLYNINAKNETFEADIYLSLKWEDPRLAFQGQTGPNYFTDQAAIDKLQTIWWPELDYITAQQLNPKITSLAIYPNGTVMYSIKLSGTFSGDMDFRKFPFDQQIFTIDIESFLWDNKTVEFIPNAENSGFLKPPNFEGLQLVDLKTSVSAKEFPYMQGAYSNFAASIYLKRSPGFFLYQILIPLLIVLIVNCCMFYFDVSAIDSRLFIGQGSILVLVAMKFMINQDLPQIDYLTIIDYIFFLAYICNSLSIFMSVLEYILWKKKNTIAERLNKTTIWIPLVIFVVLYFILLAIAKLK